MERGGLCRAFALPSGRCWNHAPERADERRAARAKGGKLKALRCRRLKLDSAPALVKFVADLAQDTLSGEVGTDVARSVGYLLSLQIKLIETADIERRLAELEARMQPSGRGSRWGA